MGRRDQPEVWTTPALKEHIERLISDAKDATNQRFVDNQREVDKALAAAKSETGQALAASKEAIAKAEEKQDQYNASHNDLIRKAENLAALSMPRQEIESRVSSIREHMDEVVLRIKADVEQLRIGEGRVGGSSEAAAKARTQTNWIIALIVGVAVSLFGATLSAMGLLATLIYFLLGKH